MPAPTIDEVFERAKKKAPGAAAPTPAAAPVPPQPPAAEKPAEAKAGAGDGDNSRLLGLALTALLPTLAGAAFGGKRGAAAGAVTGGQTVSAIEESRKESEKTQREIDKESRKEKREDAKFEREIGVKEKEAGIKAEERADKKRVKGIELAQNLRKERSGLKISGDTQTSAVAIQKIRNSSSGKNVADDMALVFNYVKMLDPGSTVREGEYATAEQARGVPSEVLATYNKLTKGQRLTPAQRKDFLKSAESQWGAQLEKQKKIDSRFEDIAKRAGIDPVDILVPFGEEGSEADRLATDDKQRKVVLPDGSETTLEEILREKERRMKKRAM